MIAALSLCMGVVTTDPSTCQADAFSNREESICSTRMEMALLQAGPFSSPSAAAEIGDTYWYADSTFYDAPRSLATIDLSEGTGKLWDFRPLYPVGEPRMEEIIHPDDSSCPEEFPEADYVSRSITNEVILDSYARYAAGHTAVYSLGVCGFQFEPEPVACYLPVQIGQEWVQDYEYNNVTFQQDIYNELKVAAQGTITSLSPPQVAHRIEGVGSFHQDGPYGSWTQYSIGHHWVTEDGDYLAVHSLIDGIANRAIDRTHRIGQTKPVFAYWLICKGTVEEKILELQRRKRRLAETLVGEESSLIKELSAEDLELLLG